MKVNNLSFPYPILGSNDDVAGSYKIDGPYISRSPEKIKLTLSHVLRNHDIQQYVDTGSAEFMVELSCSKTFFRKAYFSSTPDHAIEIPESHLRDQVVVSFYIVARTDINGYLPKTAHSDYAGHSFALKKGDLLAYAGNTQFSALKQWLSSNAVGNFMEIIDGEFQNGPMKIDLNSEKISIQLSTTDYDKYSLLGSGRFDHIFHSAIVLPALMFALSQFIEAKDQFEGRAWAAVIEDRMQNDSKLNKINWIPENVPLIAQEILDNPFNRTLNAMTQIAEDNG